MRPRDFHPVREAVRNAAKLLTRRPWGRIIDHLVPRKHRHAYFMYLLGPERPKYMLWLTAVYCGQAWSEFLMDDPTLRVWRWNGDDL